MESKPLSYKSLKTVLKHVDFNLRFQLSQQSPSLWRGLELVPGYINHLEFDEFYLKINRTTYEFDVTSADNHDETLFLINGQVHENLASKENPSSKFMKSLIKKMLEQNGVLKVETLIFGPTFGLELPKALKLEVHHLKVLRNHATAFLYYYHGFFQNSSLKSVELIDTQSFEHPLIASAKKMILNTHRFLKELDNQEIHAKFQIDAEYLLDLVERWLEAESGKEAGARYTFEMESEEEAWNLIDVVKRKYEM